MRHLFYMTYKHVSATQNKEQKPAESRSERFLRKEISTKIGQRLMTLMVNGLFSSAPVVLLKKGYYDLNVHFQLPTACGAKTLIRICAESLSPSRRII